jgi:3D (Asp-Asp-Asp) domain-containing protein
MAQLLAKADEPYSMPVVLKPELVVEQMAEPPPPEPEWQSFEVTAYTAGEESTGKSPSDADYGVTASGKRVRANHTVACPPSLAFGTRLEIEGIGVRVCEDRGGRITEGHIDVYMSQLKEARQFGRKHLRVRIIEEESE